MEEAAAETVAFGFPQKDNADDLLRIESPESRENPPGEEYDFERIRRELNAIVSDLRHNQLDTYRRFAVYVAGAAELHRRVSRSSTFKMK